MCNQFVFDCDWVTQIQYTHMHTPCLIRTQAQAQHENASLRDSGSATLSEISQIAKSTSSCGGGDGSSSGARSQKARDRSGEEHHRHHQGHQSDCRRHHPYTEKASNSSEGEEPAATLFPHTHTAKANTNEDTSRQEEEIVLDELDGTFSL